MRTRALRWVINSIASVSSYISQLIQKASCMTLDFLEDYDSIPFPHFSQQLYKNVKVKLVNYVTGIRIKPTITPFQ